MSDAQRALDAKNKGNAAFSAKKYEEAVQHFDEAISLDPSNQILYSNRSACYNALNQYDKALLDGNKAVELKPDWSKGYLRQGNALFGLMKYTEAAEAAKKGLELEPSNPQLQDLQVDIRAATQPKKSMFGPQEMAKLAIDPRTRDFMSQPDFLAKLRDFDRNPESMVQHLGDPRVMAAFSVITGVDLSQGADNNQQDFPSPPPTKPQPKPAEQPKPTPAPAKPAPIELTEAQKERDAGNQCYKKQRLSYELDPKDLLALNNKAAVYMEQQRFEECIELCKSASEKASEIRADYKIRSKIFTRLGNAYLKTDKIDDALKAYNHAIIEDKNAETIANLSKCEKLKKERDAQAYLSPDLSLIAKNQGIEHFRKHEFPEAIKSFEEAIRRNPVDHTIYSNRSAAYYKLTEYPLAVKDAEKTIELAPNFIKGYIRKANALFALREYQKALEACDQGLRIEENNPELVEISNKTFLAIRKQESNMTDEERIENAAKNPEIRDILQDPIMNQILQDMQTNPGAIQDHLKNPMIKAKFDKLVRAGVVRMGETAKQEYY
ncbi:tetratricopeptide-like helical domain-containing protein [Heterostelium album PN500]|uniref:Tetratricopeptide-like helical domain-containing protein n=1 Tax=Heterostelium pallidum (strain ATCC 26659 / Pp 5 / PN500) TaxID=670386 RepID=D3AWT2_HETP5|nr:tetratricopeptide-like helical domain-containing protein [Heterostelium album PN500]EFA86755.1 tetratricopeptide-like helical domain-containing protein [Heterostelium album PN500]|eukprot:XP_020438859.1 tetratricopeptide-like helical domain-containing protein [Heterostelium album PN500]